MCLHSSFNHVEMRSETKGKKTFSMCSKLGKILEANFINPYNMDLMQKFHF